MPEGLLDCGDLVRWALLPFPAFGIGLVEAAEFAAMSDPIGLDMEAVAVLNPPLDLLVGGGLTKHLGGIFMVGPGGRRRQARAGEWP